MDVRRDISWRVYLSFIGMALLCVLIVGKAVYLQQVQGTYWANMSDSLHQRIVELDADRGTIYSEGGQMLSTSLPQFDIYLDFQADGLRAKNGKVFHTYVDSFAMALSKYFGDKSAAQYEKELRAGYKKKSRYFLLKKKISFEDYKAFREFPLARLSRNKSGVIVEQSSKRLTPFGLLANRTIGLSREHIASNGKAKKQNVGLEKAYDSLLSGQKGQRLVRYVSGTAMPVDGFQVEPENGKDVITTIDVNMQDIAETALLKMMEESESLSGSCIVMETSTGKIKAIANLGRLSDGSYWENDNYALKVTEPGSTIKLATLLAVLDKGSSKPDDLVEVGTTGRMVVGPRNVTDAERSPKSVVSVKECFAHSSNVGMGKLGFKAFGNDPTSYKKYLERYGFTTRSVVDMPDIPRPRIAPLERKNGGVMNLVTMSFGYAIQVSPMQLITLYNAVANNGKMMKPYLVNQISHNGIVVKEFQPEVIHEQVADENAIAAARESMEMVAIEGTGKYAFKDMPFTVAGKTGTAHVADGTIKYHDGVFQASFAGYFPANDPKYTCIVSIRTKPHAARHYGGLVAAPVFREVATKIYAMYVEQKSPFQYALQKDSSSFFYAGNKESITQLYKTFQMPYGDSSAKSEWVRVFPRNYQPMLDDVKTGKKLMPDLRGMGLKDALQLLENRGAKVSVEGAGKVISQSLAPGSVINKGQQVIIRLT